MIPKKILIPTTKALVEAKVVVLTRILIQNRTTKVVATTKRIVDLIRTVHLNTVNKPFPFKKLILNKYVDRQCYKFQMYFIIFRSVIATSVKRYLAVHCREH